jgi:hypothetical protein
MLRAFPAGSVRTETIACLPRRPRGIKQRTTDQHMASIQTRIGVAAEQVDQDLCVAWERYPQNLSRTHLSVLLGWELKLESSDGMVAGFIPCEFERLPPLSRQLEINRVQAESLHVGIVYRDLGRPELAVEAIERAITLNPVLLK